MSVVLKIENVSKLYQLGEVGSGTLSTDFSRAWARFRGKDDPLAMVGQINDRTKSSDIWEKTGNDEFVWALKDVDFEVEQGDVLGIIGRNGAGKSTLLKLLSRVTAPTSGLIKSKGRIASLLEVGTGFHPELTGRENIYLNGAILGMCRQEVSKSLEEIVDFSGCAKYLDTPVKRYSSGMMVRLGFAVAAHLRCEILIVDEVLAVGDADFQKKCIGKMQEVSEGAGRTVLFVSHNLSTVRSLTKNAVILENGELVFLGESSEALELYSKSLKENSGNVSQKGQHSSIEGLSIDIVALAGCSKLKIDFSIDLSKSEVAGLSSEIILHSPDGDPLAVWSLYQTEGEVLPQPKGRYSIRGQLQIACLAAGEYSFSVSTSFPNIGWDHRVDGAVVASIDAAEQDGGFHHLYSHKTGAFLFTPIVETSVAKL